ncbi:MAG: hypothetical protein RLZZ624_441 [Cyanobacteriota bacterium]
MEGRDGLDGRDGRDGEARDPVRVLEQGPDRQRTPWIWLGGVSSMAWSLRIPMASASFRPRPLAMGGSA